MSRVVHPPRLEPDPAVRENLHVASANWARNRSAARASVDWDAWRERATAIRTDAVAHLPELLAGFERGVVAAGGVVHHAATAADARRIVVELCRERGLQRAAKAKSMLAEELDINGALAAAGIESVETDLGEYIVQLLGDRPSHLLAPAVHLSAVQVAELFGHDDPSDTSGLVAHARAALREVFLAADVGITGANFGVASTGTVILLESEGNIRMCTSLPRVHIALMGVEKVLRGWDDAAHMVQMLPLAAHGRPTATYTSYITGVGDDDGPDELHVVLVDDGRTALLGGELESTLHCIRCGACLYACPVYRQVGGHAYGTTYSGPIGAVLTPALEGGEGAEVAWMSSLCGACTEACPVGIPLDSLLVTVRSGGEHGRGETAFWEAWSRLWARPASYRALARTGGRALARFGWRERMPGVLGAWTEGRDAPMPAREPFHERWRRARSGVASPANGRIDGVGGQPVAVAPGAPSAAETGLSRAGADGVPSRSQVEEFRTRLEALDGVVHEVESLAAAQELARELIGTATVATWPGLAPLAANAAAPPQAQVSLIDADVGVASTGAIGIAHTPTRGRRQALLPDRQIALLRRDRIVSEPSQALALYFTDERVAHANVVFAAGPSRTADIEQRMMLGVHAPRSLDVILHP